MQDGRGGVPGFPQSLEKRVSSHSWRALLGREEGNQKRVAGDGGVERPVSNRNTRGWGSCSCRNLTS